MIRSQEEKSFIDAGLQAFCKYTGGAASRNDMYRRKLFVTCNEAHYGYPDTLLLELEGSPPRLTTMVSQIRSGVPVVNINGKTIKNMQLADAVCNAAVSVAKQRGLW